MRGAGIGRRKVLEDLRLLQTGATQGLDPVHELHRVDDAHRRDGIDDIGSCPLLLGNGGKAAGKERSHSPSDPPPIEGEALHQVGVEREVYERP